MSEKKSLLEKDQAVGKLLDRYVLVKGLLDSETLESFQAEYLNEKSEEEQHRLLRIVDDSLGIVITGFLSDHFGSDEKIISFYDQYFAADSDQKKAQIINENFNKKLVLEMKDAAEKFFLELNSNS